jgi:hypothetical protein
VHVQQRGEQGRSDQEAGHVAELAGDEPRQKPAALEHVIVEREDEEGRKPKRMQERGSGREVDATARHRRKL